MALIPVLQQHGMCECKLGGWQRIK